MIAREDRRWWAAAAGFFALWVIYGQLSPGTFNDDDVTHFFVARESLGDPSLMISLWARPLFTLVYSLPAQLGYGAVEVLTAAVMSVTLVLTGKLAGAIGLRFPLVALFLTAWQPFFFKLGYSSLVEPLGALCLASALLALESKRDRLAAVIAGLIPLARLEMVVLVPFLLAPAVRRRDWFALLLSALPVLAWDLAGWFFHGDPLWLANQILGGHFTRSFAGALPLDHYFRSLPLVTGGAILPVFLLGLMSRPADVRAGSVARLRAMFLAVLCVLALLAWDAHTFGGSVGYLRHLVAAAPLIGLIAAAGIEAWPLPARWGTRGAGIVILAVGFTLVLAVLRWDLRPWEHPVNRAVEPWIWPLGAIVCAAAMAGARFRLPRARSLRVDGGGSTRGPGRAARTSSSGGAAWRWIVVGAAALGTLVAEPPIGLDPERRLVRDAVRWVDGYCEGADRSGRPCIVAVNHPWFFFLGDHDRTDRRRFPVLNRANLERLPPGSLVVWESHYGHRLSGDVEADYFSRYPARYLPRAMDMVSWPIPRSKATGSFGYLILEVRGREALP